MTKRNLVSVSQYWFKTGDRIQLHPATDLWMMGARYGVITRIYKTVDHVQIQLDATGKKVKVSRDDIDKVRCNIPERLGQD